MDPCIYMGMYMVCTKRQSRERMVSQEHHPSASLKECVVLSKVLIFKIKYVYTFGSRHLAAIIAC